MRNYLIKKHGMIIIIIIIRVSTIWIRSNHNKLFIKNIKQLKKWYIIVVYIGTR